MRIHSNLIVECFGHCIIVVVDHPLTVVVFSLRQKRPYVARLHQMNVVGFHQCIRSIHLLIIRTRCSRSFVVHHQAHTFAFRIFLQLCHIIIWVAGYKIEHSFAVVKTNPVLPARIPTFDQHAAKSVLGGKVNVSTRVFVCSTVAAMLTTVINPRTHILSHTVIPGALAHVHLPPNTHIFLRSKPF